MKFDAAYHRAWKKKHRVRLAKERKANYKKNRLKILNYQKSWYLRRGGKFSIMYDGRTWQEHRLEQNLKKKIAVLQIISDQKKPTCVACGISDIRVLTINHVNGGGGEEKKALKYASVKHAVSMGFRGIDDLEVRCFNCNWIDDYEKGRRLIAKNWEELYELFTQQFIASLEKAWSRNRNSIRKGMLNGLHKERHRQLVNSESTVPN